MFSYKLLLCSICAIFTVSIGTCWRIIGGKPTKEGDFPYQVSLRNFFTHGHYCGGSIITDRHILTAAHCVYYKWGGTYHPKLVKVVAGQIDIGFKATTIYKEASKIYLHENFNATSMANDVAIIELTTELPIGSGLCEIIPLNNKVVNSGKCLVSGWGVQEYESTNISSILLSAEVNIIDFKKCKDMYEEDDIELSDGMLCAGHPNGETDACQGDSGGPLVCDGILIGVVSTGSGCGDAHYPGIYSDVAQYLSWIQDKIGTNNITTTSFRNFSDTNGSNLVMDTSTIYTSIIANEERNATSYDTITTIEFFNNTINDLINSTTIIDNYNSTASSVTTIFNSIATTAQINETILIESTSITNFTTLNNVYSTIMNFINPINGSIDINSSVTVIPLQNITEAENTTLHELYSRGQAYYKCNIILLIYLSLFYHLF